MRVLAMALTLMALVACERKASQYVAPPPPEVIVSTPQKQQVTSYVTFTGTTAGVEKAEIRARVKGFLQKIHFAPGTRVKAGDLLFTIDPSTYQVTVAQAKAAIQGAQATLEMTTLQYTKARDLFAKQAATALEVDEWKAKRDHAAATLDQAKATLAAAELDLGYTEVRSPIEGIVSENLVDVGALVGASDPTLLTTVINNDRIYAYFDLSERDLLRLQGEQRARGQGPRALGTVPVEMALGNDAEHAFAGVIDFADNTLDSTTGTLRLRAVFDNQKRMLNPGMFVRLRAADQQRELFVVPEAALGRDQTGPFLMVVGGDGVVERRGVKLAEQLGDQRAVQSGLTGGEAIIVRGLLRARAGGKVTAKTAETAAAAPAVPAAAAAH